MLSHLDAYLALTKDRLEAALETLSDRKLELAEKNERLEEMVEEVEANEEKCQLAEQNHEDNKETLEAVRSEYDGLTDVIQDFKIAQTKREAQVAKSQRLADKIEEELEQLLGKKLRSLELQMEKM